MRLSLYPVAFFLLCALIQPAFAAEDAPALNTGQSFAAAQDAAEQIPVYVEADRLEGKGDSQIEAAGNAILRKGEQSIRADRLLYFQDRQELEAQGSVRLEQEGSVITGPELKLNLDTDSGSMTKPNYILTETGGRGAADILHIQDKQHFSLDNPTYTTCPADNQDWQMRMGELEIDRDRQIGVAHNAWVEFMGVPILYTPWLDFALNNQRKSGLLAPIIGSTSKGGSEVTLPYYWNIAPNLDATIAPRVITKRGLMLNNEFRYLQPDYAGELHVDVLPDDKLTGTDRGRFALKHNEAWANNLSGYLNFSHVSDDAYFRDLADSVNSTSLANLLQEGGINYDAGWWSTAARVQRFQTLQDPLAPIVEPYARLPQVTVNAQRGYLGANVAFAGEFVQFSHPTLLNATRVVINPSISYPLLNDSALYVTPKLGLHSTYYAIGANNSTALKDTTRTLPILSVDSGIAFERDLNALGQDYIQTFEPRAFYVYIPFQDQALLPNFDTAQADFSFTQIFTENRFFGSDRIGDANQLTLAATSRFIESSSGMERLKVSVAERFSVTSPRVNLVAPAASTNKSDILLAAAGQVSKAWSFDSLLQLDPNQTQTQRYNISVRYRPESGKLLNLGYRFQRDVLRQVDFSTQWPLSSRWHAVARWNYSFPDSRILDSIAGLEYNQSCWTLRLVAQHFTTATQQTTTGFFVQLELNDFVKVGSDPLGLLKQSVPGYSKLNDKPDASTSQVLQ